MLQLRWGAPGRQDDGALAAQKVERVGATKAQGLHSPVLLAGGFPIIDSVVTSFDSLRIVQAASYTSGDRSPLCSVAAAVPPQATCCGAAVKDRVRVRVTVTVRVRVMYEGYGQGEGEGQG